MSAAPNSPQRWPLGGPANGRAKSKSAPQDQLRANVTPLIAPSPASGIPSPTIAAVLPHPFPHIQRGRAPGTLPLFQACPTVGGQFRVAGFRSVEVFAAAASCARQWPNSFARTLASSLAVVDWGNATPAKRFRDCQALFRIARVEASGPKSSGLFTSISSARRARPRLIRLLMVPTAQPHISAASS